MRKGAIVYLKRFKALDFVYLNRSVFLIGLLFIVGLIIGLVIYPENTKFSGLSELLLEKYIAYHSKYRFFSELLFTAFNYFTVIILLFLSGSSMLGVAVIPFIISVLGIICGNFTAFLYAEHSLKGIAFNAIIFIPPTLIFIICSFFAAKEAVNFSLVIARLTMPKSKPANIFINFKNYSTKFLIFTVLIIFAALVDSLLSMFFLSFFDF